MTTKQTVTGWAAIDALKDGHTLSTTSFGDKFQWDHGRNTLMENWKGGDNWQESEAAVAFFFEMEFEVEE